MSETNSKKFSGELILIVEDEPVLREMQRTILEGCGYRILEAASGREALDLWNQSAEKIDLLLTDMILPRGISGVQVAERLRAHQPQLKIIFSSGNLAEESAEMLTRIKAHFLQKPYIYTDLIQAVRDALDGKSPGQNEQNFQNKKNKF